MGWNAGADVTTGDLITAAQWNNYLGVAGSLEYLQSWSQTDVTGSRAIDGTIYQNTKDWFILVSVMAVEDAESFCALNAQSDAATPPTLTVAYSAGPEEANGNNTYLNLFFVVLPSNYYEVNNVNVTLHKWIEWGPA